MMNNRSGLHPNGIHITLEETDSKRDRWIDIMSGSRVHRRPVYPGEFLEEDILDMSSTIDEVGESWTTALPCWASVRRAGALSVTWVRKCSAQGIRSALSSDACCLLLNFFQVHFSESDQSFLTVYFLLKACLSEGWVYVLLTQLF